MVTSMPLLLSIRSENAPNAHKREGFAGFRAVMDGINNKKLSSHH
jgi:hypothetical protein